MLRHEKGASSPDELDRKYSRRGKLAAYIAAPIIGTLAGSEIASASTDESHPGAIPELAARSGEQNALTPESLISDTTSELAKLDKQVLKLYGERNPHVKKYPYVERSLDGREFKRDYYVVKLPAGTKNGKRTYDKFVAAIARDKTKPNEYRVALDTTEYKTSNPAFDLYPKASELMKLVYTEVPPTELALNITKAASTKAGSVSPPQNIYSINRSTGGKLTSLTEKLTTKPVSVSTVAAKLKYFETKASQITSKA